MFLKSISRLSVMANLTASFTYSKITWEESQERTACTRLACGQLYGHCLHLAGLWTDLWRIILNTKISPRRVVLLPDKGF